MMKDMFNMFVYAFAIAQLIQLVIREGATQTVSPCPLGLGLAGFRYNAFSISYSFPFVKYNNIVKN